MKEVITSVSVESRLVVNLMEVVFTSVSVESRLVVNLMVEGFTSVSLEPRLVVNQQGLAIVYAVYSQLPKTSNCRWTI